MDTAEERSEINSCMSRLKVGESMVYFTGELSRERMSPGASEINRIADCAIHLSDLGLVQLTQRRLEPNAYGVAKYEYIATGLLPRKLALKRAA